MMEIPICIFRDPVNNLEYIRNSKELHEKGLYIELEAYKCQVFTSFREVQDNEWHQYCKSGRLFEWSGCS